MASPLPFDPIEEAQRQWAEHDWSDAAPGMALVTSVVRAQRIFLDRIDAVLRPLGLTFARYELLVLLDFSRRGELPLGRIGARLQVHPASVTNAVDRLAADALVRRVRHPEDGRTTLAHITGSGRRVARRATEQLNDEVFGSAAIGEVGLDDEMTTRTIATLKVLRRSAGDFC